MFFNPKYLEGTMDWESAQSVSGRVLQCCEDGKRCQPIMTHFISKTNIILKIQELKKIDEQISSIPHESRWYN
jgi:hypothetical protein